MAQHETEFLEIFPGYTVEKMPEPEHKHGAYKITGPRGNWLLLRNQVNPHMLFPVPENILHGPVSIKGYKWFTDKDGTLKGVR